MNTLAVIGGIGSGKSTVSRMLSEYGAAILDLDTLGHEVLRDNKIKEELVAVFGDEILDNQGKIVRKALAKRAFSDDASTRQLTLITGPAILIAAEQWLAVQDGRGQDCAVIEISAFDGPEGYYSRFASADSGFLLVAVVAPAQMRVNRAVSKGFERDDVWQRISRQASDEKRRKWADFVIDNSGSESELRAQVENLWRSIND